MTSPVQILDVITADLLANAGLPVAPKKVVRYLEPEAIEPHECPLLATWLGPIDYTLIDTMGGYERQHHLFVAWYEYNGLQAEVGGTGNEAAYNQLAPAMDPLTRRLATYAQGVPGLGTDVVATIVNEERMPTAGNELQGKVEIVFDTLLGW